MNDLVKAAQAVIDRWDSPLWKDAAPTAEFIHALRREVERHRAAVEAVELPDPDGARLRYRSESGMIGAYPWSYIDGKPKSAIRPEHECEHLYTTTTVRTLIAPLMERLGAAERKVAELRGDHVPTPDDIEAQNWAGMDGAIAYHLIDRHSENWGHAGRLMHAWRDANPPPAEQPGAVGLSEREAFEKWGIAEGLQAKSDDRGMNYPLGDHLWRAWQARAALATQPVAAAAERQQAGPRTAISDPNVLIRNESRMGLSGAADGQQAATQGAKT